MKEFRILLLFALVAVGLSIAQNQQSATAPAGDPQPLVALNPQVRPSPITILTPTPGQTLTDRYVHLRFELSQPVPSGEPIFLVQLDSREPISMSDTDYTFPDELQPGPHTIRVTLVDANNMPIEGATATVQFKVPALQPANNNGSPVIQSAAGNIAGAAPAPPIPPELHNDGDIKLPLRGSPLPLLSLIGFGLLIGGAAHAMRTPKGPTHRAAL